MTRFVWLYAALSLVLSLGCDSLSPQQETDFLDDQRVGDLELALTATSASGTQYRLTNATFVIEGPESAEVSSDTDPDASVIVVELDVGEYTAELQNGWVLQRILGGIASPVAATLISPNPATFNIQDEAVTSLRFQFQVDEGVIGGEDGILELGIDVIDGTTPPGEANGCVRFAFIPDQNGDQTILGLNFAAPLDATDEVATARVLVVAPTGPAPSFGLQLILQGGAASNFAGIFPFFPTPAFDAPFDLTVDVAADTGTFVPTDLSFIGFFITVNADTAGAEELVVYLDSITFANGTAGPFDFTSDLNGFVFSSSTSAPDATATSVACPF